jgi:NAD(P)-dependent dehydrogenase (short-subunit alcohol dehydrogenase family)
VWRYASQNGCLDVMQCDLTDPESVRAFAAAFNAKYYKLHLLVNSACLAMLPE